MYLSCLLIDVGRDPDHPRPGRLWLRNLYRVHQRLCMAFPSAPAISEDPDFLQPFKPESFDQVHVVRGTGAGFLFRIEPQPGASPVIVVQSATEPNWEYAFHNARYLLACRPQVKPFNPCFDPRQRLQFRLLANPVRKVSLNSLDFAGKPFEPKWIGKDVPVPTAELRKSLERRAEPGWSPPKNSEDKQCPPGFRLVDPFHIQPGYVYVNDKRDGGSGRRLRSARYDGVLEVTDPAGFRNTVIKGIGPGKAFGFGLLSVAPPPAGGQA